MGDSISAKAAQNNTDAMKTKGGNPRNGIAIAVFVVFALVLGIWLTSRSSSSSTAASTILAAKTDTEKPFHATIDGGIFALVRRRTDHTFLVLKLACSA